MGRGPTAARTGPRKLLAARHKLRVKLTVAQASRVIISRTVVLKLKPRKQHHAGRHTSAASLLP